MENTSGDKKPPRDNTKTLPALLRRLDSLAYLLLSDDTCVAVAFWLKLFRISNNEGEDGYIKRWMGYLSRVGETKDMLVDKHEKEGLIETGLNKRIDEFKSKYKSYQDLLRKFCPKINEMFPLGGGSDEWQKRLGEAYEENPEIKQLIDELEKQDKKLSEKTSEGKLLDREEEGKACKVKSSDEIKKELIAKLKMNKPGNIKKVNESQLTKEEVKENYKKLKEMKKTSLPPKSPEQLEKDKIASLLDELYKIKDRKTRIRLREKKVRTRLEKCVHKVLRSLTCSYPQDSEKNFSDEMRKMKFQFLSPFQGSKGKVHAEMNILQFIFDKTSKFADIKEPIYIGTSLLACFDCNSIYNQVNKSNLIFEYRGTSNWRFRCWQEADFMGKLGLDINLS